VSGYGVGYRESFADGSAAFNGAGASPEAIQFHYDVGTDFFRTWLGDELIYSAARWREPLSAVRFPRTLEAAQTNKLDFHLRSVRAGGGRRLLDIGCGWGAMMRRAVETFGAAEAIGATLSSEQFDYVQSLSIPRTKLDLQSYETLALSGPVDGIVTIGALEHFAKPQLLRSEKIAIYGNFFDRCRSFLNIGGRMSLQTIFWQNVDRRTAAEIVPTSVFPESDLPFLDEIFEASHRQFRTLYLETSEDDYALTLREWLKRLRRARKQNPQLVDEAKFFFHEDYLRRCIVGFQRHRISLARIVFERL
jgi:cyclopropane-fatty-acyl-phospholipid synthase